jgi:hypothetical protein
VPDGAVYAAGGRENQFPGRVRPSEYRGEEVATTNTVGAHPVRLAAMAVAVVFLLVGIWVSSLVLRLTTTG